MEEENSGALGQARSLLIMAQIQDTARKVRQTFYAPPRPQPGNDSTAPLLSSSDQGDNDTRVHQEVENSANTPLPVMVFVKLFITFAPFFIVLVSWAILLGAGLDPLAFGMLSFYLTLALLMFIIVIADIQVRLARRQRAKERNNDTISEPEPQPQPPKDWKHVLYMTLGILGIYILFYGVIWMWATITDDGNDNGLPSTWHIFVVSRALQAKIGGPSSIELLGTCLQKSIPDRNATIEDVSQCLKAMGMKDSYAE